jgi:hypothetical protein
VFCVLVPLRVAKACVLGSCSGSVSWVLLGTVFNTLLYCMVLKHSQLVKGLAGLIVLSVTVASLRHVPASSGLETVEALPIGVLQHCLGQC